MLHILPSPIMPSAKWAKGAKSPLAPTVPCSGTQGRQEATKQQTNEHLSRHQYKKVGLEFPREKWAVCLTTLNVETFSELVTVPLKASTSCKRVCSFIPLYPLAKTLIRSARSMRVFSGGKGWPTPAACERIKFSCSSLDEIHNTI